MSGNLLNHMAITSEAAVEIKSLLNFMADLIYRIPEQTIIMGKSDKM